MSAPGKLPVPKFSSFKPAVKRPASPDPNQAPASTKRRKSVSPHDQPSSSSRHVERNRRDHHRSKDRDRGLEPSDITRHDDHRAGKKHHGRERGEKNHHDHHRGGGRHHGGERNEAKEKHPVNSVQPTHYSAPEETDLYIVDRKGDPQNWTYQSLHKYSIPQYRRTGYGNVLGLATRYKIDREASLDNKINLTDTHRRPTSTQERALLKRPKRHHVSELRVSQAQGDSFDPIVDFISLRSTRIPACTSSPEPQTFDEIRSLQVTDPSALRPADPDLVYVSSEEDLETSAPDVEARQRNVELSRATKSDPSSLQPWLDLAHHQQHLVRPGASADLSDLERRTLADLRLHIYEKAAKSIPVHDKSSRESLYHSMFREAFLVWDLETYLQKLNHAIRELPTSFLLLTMYLDAAQTKPVGFRFEDTKAFFLESLRSMHSAASTSKANTIDVTEDVHLYIVLRYTAYLRETGYEELSIAVWQALFEYNLYRPIDSTHSGGDAILESFEAFWESETPRFGELNSRGWRNGESEDTLLAESDASYEQQTPSYQHPFHSFAVLEQAASDPMRFPGRTTEETISDDPFHIVLFSDMKDILETIPFQFSHDGLIDAFLCYLGLPARPASGSDHITRLQAWRSDPFLSNGLLGDIGRSHQTLQNTTQTLFSDLLFPAKSETSTSHEVLFFARNSLVSLVQDHPEDEVLAEYYLAFASHYYPSEASKIAKSTLKRRPTSLRLYNACAMVESKLNRTDKAAHIWAGALKMKNGFPPRAQEDAILLWHGWIWSDMQQGDEKTALLRLISFDGNIAPDTASVLSSATLRVKKAFQEGFEHAISQRNSHIACLNAECLALLAYIGRPDTLTAAIGVVHEHIIAVQDAGPGPNDLTVELLHQAKANLFGHHIKQQRSYKPAFIRSELETSIKLFPNNTMFLRLYAQNEARFRIDDRVRAVLRDDIAADRRSALVRFSFEVDQEMSRCRNQASGSTIESVRATFARALLANGSPVRHSKALWVRWLLLEEEVVQTYMADPSGLKGRTGQQAVQKWRDVFLGGLHRLPWVKEWILMGLECFDGERSYAWSTRELKGLYNVLQERELRVRIEGLEDVLDGIAEGMHSSKH